MATVAQAPTTRKAPKAFYAHLYDTHGTITRVDGEYVFMADDGTLTVVDMEMFPWIQLHGEIGLCETQAFMDQLHGGAIGIALARAREAH